MRDHNRENARAVGIRELKTRAASILRQVREQHASYVVTHRGRAIGVLLPADPFDSAQDAGAEAAWAAFLRAGRRLEKAFRPRRSVTKALSASRR